MQVPNSALFFCNVTPKKCLDQLPIATIQVSNILLDRAATCLVIVNRQPVSSVPAAGTKGFPEDTILAAHAYQQMYFTLRVTNTKSGEGFQVVTMNDEQSKIEIGEVVTVGDQPGEFIVDEIHPEKDTVDLRFVADHSMKLRDVPVCDLTKSRTPGNQ